MGNYTPNSFMIQPTHLPPLNIPKFSSPPNPNKPTKMQSSLKSGAFSQKQSKAKRKKQERNRDRDRERPGGSAILHRVKPVQLQPILAHSL